MSNSAEMNANSWSRPTQSAVSEQWAPLAAVALVVVLLIGCQPSARWLTISYGALVDPDQLTHSGATVEEKLRELASGVQVRGEVQPFLEPFAGLLLDVRVGPFARDSERFVIRLLIGGTEKPR
jgi:hypothetical protein